MLLVCCYLFASNVSFSISNLMFVEAGRTLSYLNFPSSMFLGVSSLLTTFQVFGPEVVKTYRIMLEHDGTFC